MDSNDIGGIPYYQNFEGAENFELKKLLGDEAAQRVIDKFHKRIDQLQRFHFLFKDTPKFSEN